MMKKFSISTQLLILVLTILLSTSILFIIITYFSLQKVAADQAITRMFSVKKIDVIQADSDIATSSFNDMPLYFIDYNEKDGYHYSVDAEKFIPLDEFEDYLENNLKKLVEKTFSNEANNSKKPFWQEDKPTGDILPDAMEGNIYRGANIYHTKKGATLYYSFSSNRECTQFTFIFTDNTYATAFIRDVALRMFSTFLGILFVAVMCIYVWSTRITKRLKAIQEHIIDLPKDKYEKEYVDDSDDEIGELSRSVEVMRKEIGHNENTKQEMLQNLSHDFKTPIAVIKSYAEAIQDGMAGPEAVDTIIEQAESLKKKVNRLLQYNSLEYLTKDKPFEQVNMSELVNRVVEHYKFQTNLKFTLDIIDNVIFEGYPENWSTVVENIIDNAKRYAKSEIRIILRENHLRIYNDGEPIDEQFLNSVFKPYEKGSRGQFGLGMSIVKKTVDFFGMNMLVRNEENGGVSFIIKKNEVIE